MDKEKENPSTPPENSGQAGGQAKPANTAPAAGNNQSKEELNENKDAINLKEIEELKRDAGRWKAYQRKARLDRREKRTNRSDKDYDLDGATPEVLEALKSRDSKLDELSLVNRTLLVKDKARDLVESDEYKDLSPAIKKAVIRNPLGFVNPTSDNLEDAVADIQDYLDESLDDSSINGKKENIEIKEELHQTPPGTGSAPASPNAAADVDLNGKSGQERSTSILSNLLKNRK